MRDCSLHLTFSLHAGVDDGLGREECRAPIEGRRIASPISDSDASRARLCRKARRKTIKSKRVSVVDSSGLLCMPGFFFFFFFLGVGDGGP